MSNKISFFEDINSEEMYRSLYENSPDLHRTINLKGEVINCNKSYLDTLGYSKSEVIDQTIFTHIAEESILDMRETFNQWKSGLTISNNELWFKKKNGDKFLGLMSANNLYDKNNNLIGSNTTIRDITEITIIKKKLSKQLEINVEAEKKKQEFLSMMTHEFKTPLTPILSWTDMLSEKALGEITKKQEMALNKISNNATKILELIDDVLDANKLDLEQMTFTKIQTNSKEIALSIVNDYEAIMLKNKIKFISSNIENVSLITDKSRIEQILRIFITNAIDFVPKNEGQIEVKVVEESDFIIFSVIDNGIGVPIENQEKLFAKFYQIDSSITRKHGGSGLGLSVASGIIKGLDGRIGINSIEGEGSEFFIKNSKNFHITLIE